MLVLLMDSTYSTYVPTVLTEHSQPTGYADLLLEIQMGEDSCQNLNKNIIAIADTANLVKEQTQLYMPI